MQHVRVGIVCVSMVHHGYWTVDKECRNGFHESGMQYVSMAIVRMPLVHHGCWKVATNPQLSMASGGPVRCIAQIYKLMIDDGPR